MHHRYMNIVIMLSLVVVLLGPAALAQTGAIQGWVKTSAGQFAGEDEVRPCIEGASSSARDHSYGRIYWDGVFRVPEGGTFHNSTPNMLPGTYAVGMSDEYEWRPRNYSYVKVQNGQTTTCNMTIPGTYEVRNQNGMTGTFTNVGQSFVAKGGSLQRMTLWLTPVPYRITVHQGGPGGPQVGAARDLGSGTPTITWNYGEIPTVAGQTYYINFRNNDGQFQTYRRNDNPYPGGTAYYNGVAQNNTDLMMTLFEDCDGQASMYHVHLSGSSTNDFYAGEIGQTFKTLGSNILSVSVRLRTGGPSRDAFFSIHQGGPGGPQIGPTKCTKVYDYNPVGQKVTAAWLPGEVPVTPGSTYYMRLYAPDGFYVFCAAGDKYPDGRAYRSGAQWDGDLIGTIMGEVTPNSSICILTGTVRDAVGNPVSNATVAANNCGYSTLTAADGTYILKMTGDVYNLTCSKTGYASQSVNNFDATAGTSKTLNWTIAMPGRISGYVRSATTGAGIVGANVSITPGNYSGTTGSGGYFNITGINPGTYSGTACFAGYQCQTRSGLVVTQGANTSCDFSLTAQTSLINPGFELGDLTGWTPYGHGLNVAANSSFGITPHTGTHFALNAASWTDPKTGGLYQKVSVVPGVPITASVFALCYGEEGGAANTFSRIGADPTGGTNPTGASIQWGPWYNSPQDNLKQWVWLSKTVTPTGEWLTLFLDYKQQPNGVYAWKWQINAFDDASLSADYGERISIAAAKQRADSSLVYVGPGIISAKFAGSPDSFYIQDVGRVSGLMVKGTIASSAGDSVNVAGFMRTQDGERYIEMLNSDVQQAGIGVPEPLGMKNLALGGDSQGMVPGIPSSAGLNNIGLLVTTWGRVQSINSSSFYLQDGSGAAVQVVVPAGTTVPVDNSYAVVTGISSTYDSGGIKRLIRAIPGGVASYTP